MGLEYISSHKNYMKKILNTLLAIAIFTAPILYADRSQSLGNYPPHAHPFDRIGSGYSQSSGDNYCRWIFNQYYMVKPQFGSESFSLNTSPLAADTSPKFYRVYAYNRVEITFTSHVWYHKNNGECVANVGRY
jgi:hypothetical protein